MLFAILIDDPHRFGVITRHDDKRTGSLILLCATALQIS